jgi:predicted metal-dependent hydrolase
MSLGDWLMRQMSLFGEPQAVEEAAPPTAKQGKVAVQNFEEKSDIAGIGTQFNAIKIEATGGAFGSTPTTRQTARQTAPFCHPRANRQALLNGQSVAYVFRRGRRRTIGFSVNADGLTLSAPRWVLVGDAERALHEKADWIVRKLHDVAERESRIAQQRIDWRDGVVLPFLGEPVRVCIDAQGSGAQLIAENTETAQQGMERVLRVGLAHNAAPAQLRDAVQAWLMRQAKRVFAERIEHFAPQLGVRCTALRLSSAGTRWGSAHADGVIRLNWRLIHFGMRTIDYVVVHELSHLREMNHSPRFWATVESVMPDYVQRKGQLKDESIPLWE